MATITHDHYPPQAPQGDVDVAVKKHRKAGAISVAMAAVAAAIGGAFFVGKGSGSGAEAPATNGEVPTATAAPTPIDNPNVTTAPEVTTPEVIVDPNLEPPRLEQYFDPSVSTSAENLGLSILEVSYSQYPVGDQEYARLYGFPLEIVELSELSTHEITPETAQTLAPVLLQNSAMGMNLQSNETLLENPETATEAGFTESMYAIKLTPESFAVEPVISETSDSVVVEFTDVPVQSITREGGSLDGKTGGFPQENSRLENLTIEIGKSTKQVESFGYTVVY